MRRGELRHVRLFVTLAVGVTLLGACKAKPTEPGAGADAQAPLPATEICKRTGRFTAVAAGGACPPIAQLSGLEPEYPNPSHNSGAYEGALPRCPGFDPQQDGRGFKFRFRVDQVQARSNRVDNGRDTYTVHETWLHGANLDQSPVCGHMMVFSSTKERPVVAPGTILQIAQRLFLRSDTDTPSAHVVADEAGRTLFAVVVGARLAGFPQDFGDLLPRLTLSSPGRQVCTASDIGEVLGAMGISTAAGTGCELDSHSERCCSLWSLPYEVQLLNAFLPPTPERPGDSLRLGFTLRDPAFFAPAQ